MPDIHRLTIEKEGFRLDGAPFRFIAGAIHYFRVPRAYWRDRLRKLRACGFNAVETYVAWNAHQPTEDSFVYDDMLDIVEYLRIAQEEGLYAIVRPGPYICSEWEMGGLPWWLLKYDDVVLRCMNERYLTAVDRFYDDLMPRLVPLLSTNGGPILMMQVENEYGSYGDDREYMRYIRDGLIRRGIDVPLFTSDGATDWMLTGGTVEGCLKTANFGSRIPEQFAKLREFQPEGPLMCSEFWNGWFDHWGEEHHSRDPKEAADVLDELLATGASVSAYMFHGGTYFGWMNGANCPDVALNKPEYQPTVSSYDDDAPVNEYGGLTPKYFLFRDVVSKYAPVPEIELPEVVLRGYGKVTFTQCADLLDVADDLSTPVQMTMPQPMEKLGQGYGFILYRTHIRGPRESQPIVIDGLHDRAHVFLNGEFKGILYRNDENHTFRIAIPAEGAELAILVENMGRTNYGPHMIDRKGIETGVRAGRWPYHYHWEALPLPLNNLDKVSFGEMKPFDGRPQLLRGTFTIEGEPNDTFVRTDGFKKGIIFVNGQCLSRYWEIGPQKTAYLPAPFLKEGENELIVLELDGRTADGVLLTDTHDLGEIKTIPMG